MEIISILERIYERHYGLFCKIGCEIYGLNIETTYDIIHDSFIKVFKNRSKIKSESEPGIRGYFIKTFRNECVSYLNRQNRFLKESKESSEEIINMSTGIKTADTLNEILLIEEYRLQECAIRMINSEKYQEPVKLYLQGYKVKDIANKINKKYRATQTLIRRGLREYNNTINKLDPLRKD